MPPRPDVPYSPVPSVVPPTQQPDNYMRVQATPEAFGGEVGAAEQQAGARVQQGAEQFNQIALAQQGMINETLATNAESDYLTKAGQLAGQFRSLQGLAASAALPKFQSDMQTLRTQLRTNLPAGAARAYDMLTMRHQGYYLGDANAYAAQQIKSADTSSAKASMELAVSRAGDLPTAMDDTRFGGTLQDASFQAARILQNQGYGPDAGTGMMQDAKTGAITFNDTPAGQQAKAAYDNLIQQAHGAAWENRLHTLADQNVMAAYQTFEKNRSEIPGQTQVKLDAFFTPRIRAAQAQGTADGILQQFDARYTGATGPSNPDNMGNVKAAAGGFAQPATPTDGVVLAANTLRRGYGGLTLQQIGQKWEGTTQQNINNWVQNVSEASVILPGEKPDLNDPATLQRLLTGIATAEKSKGDRALFTDAVIQQGVTDALGGKTAAMGQSTAAAGKPAYQSLADYYRANYENIVGTARTQAEADHPDDPVYIQQATARVEQRINDVIRQQELSYKQDGDLVYQAFSGALSRGTRPTSVDQMTAIGPNVKAAWDRLQTENPIMASNIENRILVTQSRGGSRDAMTYGPAFYTLFSQIHADPGSPERLTDVNELYQHVGHDLTMAGLEKLRSEMDKPATPETQAGAAMVKSALAYAKHQLSFAQDFGTFKIPDPKGEDAFNVNFLPAFYKAYDAGIAAGKTPYQLLSKDSPDFIVDKLVSPYKRTDAQWMQDRIAAGAQVSAGNGQTATPDVTTRQGLVNAVQNGLMTREQGEAIALKNGWIRADAAPTGDNVSVPISR